MAEKLAYLRSAFSALGSGLQVVDRRNHEKRPAAIPVESTPTRSGSGPRLRPMLSKVEFDRLTIDQKLEYLDRAHRDLQEAARKWGRGPKEPGPIS